MFVILKIKTSMSHYKIISFSVLFMFALLFSSCEKSTNELPDDRNALSSPMPEDKIFTGVLFEIKWYAPSFNLVDIDLYKDSKFVYTIAESVEDNSSYNWMVAEDLLEASDYSIKITNSNNKSQFFSSQQNFSIKKYLKETSQFTDPLDGQVYKTVKIGNQWWMSENYRFEAEGSSWFFKPPSNISDEFGKLYTYEAVLNLDVPDGWHLPSNEEWKVLNDFFEKSAVIGLQTNGGSGFDVILSGYYNACNGFYQHEEYESCFWTSTISRNGYPSFILLSILKDQLLFATDLPCREAMYIRFIKDEI